MARCTPVRPRALRERRKSLQNTYGSLSPTAVPSTSRVPSTDTPVATTIACETTWAPFRSLGERGVGEHVRELGVGQRAGMKRFDFGV
jgi:hypothetical protein